MLREPRRSLFIFFPFLYFVYIPVINFSRAYTRGYGIRRKSASATYYFEQTQRRRVYTCLDLFFFLFNVMIHGRKGGTLEGGDFCFLLPSLTWYSSISSAQLSFPGSPSRGE
ncbi:hypothetical protein N658DRAFT_51396 [Parathielavia hyrcaniae]|uniref:Uncharacterized protein n=1 Tax=Parathielavia hyrcaniae TaxID=113614 RepID=A0AAN6Q2M3_9PEZI|nr:hypothetical protein N658DRAFT_51396 [Parathielavia hyrcaniae]